MRERLNHMPKKRPEPIIPIQMDSWQKIGERVMRRRYELNWRMEDLVSAANLCDHSQISRLEGRYIPKGRQEKRVAIRVETLYGIACALGVTMEYLLTGK